MKSRGMSELPPENAVLNRPLSPAPATLRPVQKPPSAAQGGALQDVPGAGIPHPRRDPRPADAACIGHSVDGPGAQVHNSMSHNILAL